MEAGGRATSRRAEYAETTRQAILDAARRLFREKGFFSTKVDDIAALARVSPATIYAVAGGKQGLLRTLMDTSTASPKVTEAIRRIDALDDPNAIVSLLAKSVRLMRDEFGDVMRLLMATAPHDATASETLAMATHRYRDALRSAARRLSWLGALKGGVTPEHAADILWFYFGYHAYFALILENYWSPDQAETWLADQAARSLFGAAEPP